MKKFAICLAPLVLAGPVLAADPAPDTPRPRMVKIVLIGDSTVAAQGGWGPSLCGYHVTSAVACVNLAKGGRSSGSYRAERSWEIAMEEVKGGGFDKTYVLIQFGHNDQPGKPGRSTDLATEFPANLKRYVEEIRAAGAEPILATPLTRRQFKDGVLQDDLGPWAETTRRVAGDLKVPLIDLHARSRQAVQEMGPTQANRFAQMPPPPEVAAAAGGGGSRPDRHHHSGQQAQRPRRRPDTSTEQCGGGTDGPGQTVLRLHPSGSRRGGLLRHHRHKGTGGCRARPSPFPDPLTRPTRENTT